MSYELGHGHVCVVNPPSAGWLVRRQCVCHTRARTTNNTPGVRVNKNVVCNFYVDRQFSINKK